MTSLFHLIPEDMHGWEILPLNLLKARFRLLYNEAVGKYTGREHLLREHVPIGSGCTWGDVVFLSAVPPDVLRRAYYAGCDSPWLFRKFDSFVIDPFELDSARAVVMVWEGERRVFKPYDPNQLEEYSQLPTATVEYYARERAEHTRPLIFQYVPHILYAGPIRVTAEGWVAAR